MQKIDNVILYLIGFPATGKLTTAKAIASKTNLKVIDNHLMNNPVFKILHPFKKLPDGVWDNIMKIYAVVHDTIINYAKKEDSFIFTNVLFEGAPEDIELFAKIEYVANQRGAKFVPVRLTCKNHELKRRIISPDREERFKLCDPNILDLMLEKKELMTPTHKNTLHIDVTDKQADEVADMIISKLQDLE